MHTLAKPGFSPEIAFARSELGARLTALNAGRIGANRTIADYLLRNPIKISAWSIEEFAAEIGVSTATLSRFARAAGFKGFPDLRNALAASLRESLNPVEKLRRRLVGGNGPEAAFEDGLTSTLANIETTAEMMRGADLAQIVARISSARTVYVMGFGLSSHLAALLGLNLQPFFAHLVNVVQFGGSEVAAGRLVNIGAEDVLISISFPRYARDAVDLTRFAKNLGAYVVAITDSTASPLAILCDALLIAPSAHPVISSSCAPALVLIEALVTAFMVSSEANVSHQAKLTEALSNYFYLPENGAPLK